MPERMELSHKEKQKKRLIVAAVVLVVIIIGFVIRHFVGDWLTLLSVRWLFLRWM